MNTKITNKKLSKLINGNKIILGIGIGLALLAALMFYLDYTSVPSESSYVEIGTLYDVSSPENKNAYVKTDYYPYGFAYDEEYNYYMISDVDDYLYIVTLTDDKYDEIEEKIDNGEIVTLSGYTKYIDDEMKEAAIESYNELEEEEFLTDENFVSYFGEVYLVTDTYYNDSFYIGIGIVMTPLALLFVIIGVISNNTTKNTLSSLGESNLYKLYDELNGDIRESKGTILTKSFIISNNTGLVIKEYKDVLWAYAYAYRYNGVRYDNIILYVKGRKKKITMNVQIGLKNTNISGEMLEYIKEKNPDVLIGNTKENKEQYKRLNNI